MFKRAERKKAKLRLALCAPSGGGKTYSALLIAQGLGGRIAMIDSERGSGELYSNICEYDVCQLAAPYTPDKYVKAIKEAERAGYSVIIIDSLTHAWAGTGGLLEEVDKRKGRGNDFTAWREITPMHNALVNAMLDSSCHIIGTMRTKTAYDMVKDEKTGKIKPVKIGLAPVQRDGMEYEFTMVLDIDNDKHIATASKDRTSLFDGKVFIPSIATGEELREWLESGTETTAHPPQRLLPPPQNEQQPTPTEQPHAHVSLEDAIWEFMQCNQVETLKARAGQLQIRKDNPQYEAIHAAYKTRLDDLKGNAQSQPPDTQPRSITPAQRTAIMAYYGKRRMGTDDQREARLCDLSSFFRRDITSVNVLTFDEASAFIEAISADMANREAA